MKHKTQINVRRYHDISHATATAKTGSVIVVAHVKLSKVVVVAAAGNKFSTSSNKKN